MIAMMSNLLKRVQGTWGGNVPAWLGALFIAFTPSSAALAQKSFSEPPIILYGKVLNIGSGGTYQLFSGTIQVELVDLANPENVTPIELTLRPVGALGEYSYREKITLESAPAGDEAATLGVSARPTQYIARSVTLDGSPIRFLDPSQFQGFSTSFADRMREYRFDFRVDLEFPDSDGDGIPDWWEELYGLNPALGGDAGEDPDGDGWSNRQEFNLATNPQEANLAPSLQESRLQVLAGSQSGVHLKIVDADSRPNELQLVVGEEVPGLDWLLHGLPLPAGSPFTQQDVLDGEVSLAVADSFQRGMVHLMVTDLYAWENSMHQFDVQVQGVSPVTGWFGRPSLWLTGEGMPPGTPLNEWTDASELGSDAYQGGNSNRRPFVAEDGSVQFSGGQFFYVDDRGLALQNFTMFLSYEMAGNTAGEQTLFSHDGMQLKVGGRDAGHAGRSLYLEQAGRSLLGPIQTVGYPQHMALESSGSGSRLRTSDGGVFVSMPDTTQPVSSFTTIGALRSLSASVAEEFLQGRIRELVVYDRMLEPRNVWLLQDYLSARWEDFVTWNYRNNTLAVAIEGQAGSPNLIVGGEAGDTLTGGALADIIAGEGGENIVNGGGGPDRFRIAPQAISDIVMDFNEAEGDILDLSQVFQGLSGDPAGFIRLQAVIQRNENDEPVVDTLLRLDHAGAGAYADQMVLLKGVSWGNTDLRRLVAEGTLVLGGPSYASPVTLKLLAQNPDGSVTVQVQRSGDLSAAIRVPVLFAGSGYAGLDYEVHGAQGAEDVQWVKLPRGVASADMTLHPSSWSLGKALAPELTALGVYQASLPGETLKVELPVVPSVSVQVLRHLQAGSSQSGLLQVSRHGGSMASALRVVLAYEGNLAGGTALMTPPSTVTIPAGQASVTVPLVPLDLLLEQSHLTVGLVSSGESRVLRTPDHVRVSVLPAGVQTDASFAAWSALTHPGVPVPELAVSDADGDGRSALMEYLAGTDPDVRNATHEPWMQFDQATGSLVVRTARVLTDVALLLEAGQDLTGQWTTTESVGSDYQLSADKDGRLLWMRPASAAPVEFFHFVPVLR